jgi:aryl-alcohol dehydrogenase-like predicted oxidoreductase
VPVNIELGLGIIGLGKPWGHVPNDVPQERDAIELLEFAFEIGIRYFDSAPSYGIAEERLGKFLRGLDSRHLAQLRIATKFGEHWDPDRGEPFVDHSFDALCRSLDRSLQHLGRIDILQFHKTTPEALRSGDLVRAWDYASKLGIQTLGASVSDLESAEIVIGAPRYRCIQAPLNCANVKFAEAVERASARGMWVATNRPFAMGAMLHDEARVSPVDAFRYLMNVQFSGVILTGTTSKSHLQQNWRDFHLAGGA